MGNAVSGKEIGWKYGITWFLISNPLVYLLIGFTGTALLIFYFIKKPVSYLTDKSKRNNLLYIGFFACPLLVTILAHSELYDAWRHLYFIYPSFIMLGIFGLHELFKTKAEKAIIAVIFISTGLVAYFMVSNFPFETVYFNELVRSKEPEYLKKRFDLDYWGISYRQGMEYVLKTNKAAKINIIGYSNSPVFYNSLVLKPEDRERIQNVQDTAIADYFFTNYRNHPQDFSYPDSKICYSIKILNSSVLTIYKLK